MESRGGDPEEALVEAARRGDSAAFDALLTRNETKVLRVLTLLGVPAQDREDVAQEVFLRVFRHLGGFRSGRPFGAWIYRVAVNAAHDHRLRTGRHQRDEAPWDDDVELRAAGGPDPEESAGRTSLKRRLAAGLAVLSERERAVFVLREMEGLESREVARALGITTITVRRHLGLARDRLRTYLSHSDRLPD